MRGRLHAGKVELVHPLDVLEDAGELAGHPLDLRVRELEPRKPRDVQHLLAVDHGLSLGTAERPPGAG